MQQEQNEPPILTGKGDKLEKIAATAFLFDFYAPLLTERQRTALILFYEEDLTLSEIAELNGASRQAAHDAIRRGEELLLYYESELGLAARYRKLSGLAVRAVELAQALPHVADLLAVLNELRAEI